MFSQKLASGGFSICSTTTVSGYDWGFIAKNHGSWIAYQNGTRVPVLLPNPLTMQSAAGFYQNNRE